jgi:hypothetical protein
VSDISKIFLSQGENHLTLIVLNGPKTEFERIGSTNNNIRYGAKESRFSISTKIFAKYNKNSCSASV